MRRILVALFVTTMFTASAARANGADGVDKAAGKDADTPAAAAEQTAPAAPAIRMPVVPVEKATRPAVLPILYGTFGAFQAYDVYSTTRALNVGAAEANPHMRAVVSNPALFIGLKAAITIGPIYAAERMWREHHRVGAIALMAAANGMMAAVAMHNASVLSSQQAQVR